MKKLDWRKAKKFREHEDAKDDQGRRDRLGRKAANTLRRWATKEVELSEADRKLFFGDDGG